LDLEQAKAIIEAFGSCSTVYECTTPAEMIEDYESGGCDNITDYVGILYTVEGIHMERSRDGASYQSDELQQKVIAEYEEMKAGQRERLAAIGYKVGR